MKSRPTLGILELAHEVKNQRGQIVMVSSNVGMMGLRESRDGAL